MPAFDIHFELQPASDQGGQRLFTFAYASAKGVRGFQKTINQWVKCLLTLKGSDPSAKEYGTFFSELFTANTFSLSDVEERVTIAIDDATDQTKAYQRLQPTTQLSDDERLSSATVVRLEQTGPTDYRVYVVLKNILNEDVRYVLPTALLTL